MTRFRLTVEFDGSPFMGWQRQAHGPSVQQAIEEAVAAVTGEHEPEMQAIRLTAGSDLPGLLSGIRPADCQ